MTVQKQNVFSLVGNSRLNRFLEEDHKRLQKDLERAESTERPLTAEEERQEIKEQEKSTIRDNRLDKAIDAFLAGSDESYIQSNS